MVKNNNFPPEEKIDEFFQILEREVPFPAPETENIAGNALITTWKDIGATQSVYWSWVMLCESSLVSFLTPFCPWRVCLSSASSGVSSSTQALRTRPTCSGCITTFSTERNANSHRAHLRQLARQQALPGPNGRAALKKKLSKFHSEGTRME